MMTRRSLGSTLKTFLSNNGFEAVIESSKKEKPMHSLLKFFIEIEMEGILPNSFYEASITFTPKPDKDATKKEL
jgi:hypothetical protein